MELAGTRRFIPSADGFAFANSWPAAPAVTVATPVGSLGVGNAQRGFCGGMVFAALDYWHAQRLPPAQQPAPGSPLYKFIVRRLIDSWNIPAGVAKYYKWMNLPDQDSSVTVVGRPVTQRGLPWRTIERAWPQVRASLRRGVPAPLGVVTVASANPGRLGENHQVLAYAYSLERQQVTLRVYDPNSGPSDAVTISFDASAPTKPTTLSHNLNLGLPVRGFFVAAYRPAQPP